MAQPLTQTQIEAASRFWASGWESKELAQLKQAFPGRGDGIRVKAIVLNTLYGTNVIAIYKVAGLLEELLLEGSCATGPSLVEELVERIKKKTGRGHYSFVSKFGHFFVDSNLPVLDSYAEWMVAWHLGKAQSRNPKRYTRFCENLKMLIDLAGLNCDCAGLDAYLWVAGEYRSWLEDKKAIISSDLKASFERLEKDPGSESTLRDLLGPIRACASL
ncbi:MAG: hypothetical protein ABSE35_04555 [Bryobacteraceae bacterium]